MRKIITCLDAGSSKIKVVVGEIYKDNLYVLACSEVKSKGIKNGLITEPQEAMESIKEAISKVEEILGIKLKKIITLVPSYFSEYIMSEGMSTITNETSIIGGDDILRCFQGAIYNKISDNKELISIMPIEFWLDDKEKVKDPKGKKAKKLDVKCVLGISPKKNSYTLLGILEALKLEVVDICYGYIGDYFEFKEKEYDEKNIAIINIGADITEIGIFHKGINVESEVIQKGGKNIDRDISYVYDISLKDSRKLKETFANAFPENANVNENENVLNKSNENIKINQYELSEVVYSRLKEILEESKKTINHLTKKEISYIIITGGSSKFVDFNEVATEVFGKKSLIPLVKEMGARHTKYSSILGFIKYYDKKLEFRNKFASTIDEEDEELIFSNNKKVNTNSLLGKIYGYFFDN